MGESSPAIKINELTKVLRAYGIEDEVNILKTIQLDPDTSIYEIQVGSRNIILLEADYVSDVEDVIARYKEYLKTSPKLIKVADPPEAFDYEPYLQAKPDYFTKDGDDFNQLRLYEVEYQPEQYGYPLRYFLAARSS